MMAFGHDDSYSAMQAKKSARLAPGTIETMESLSLRSINTKDASVLLRSPFKLYACFLMACSFLYYSLGGRVSAASTQDLIAMASVVAETIGLLLLQQKIGHQGSVNGISGMTVGMYSLVYTLRQIMLLPPLTLLAIDGWAIELLQLPSILIVFYSLRSVFMTHRSSYQEEDDWLKMQYLVPVCVVLALIISPQFEPGPLFSFFQATYMYLDMVALMPQVVMMSNMARAGKKVEAPIAHFVAATALREVSDLWVWLLDFDLGDQGWCNFLGYHINYSGWICVLSQVLAVLLVADFMYYYFKARLSGASLSEGLALPVESLDV